MRSVATIFILVLITLVPRACFGNYYQNYSNYEGIELWRVVYPNSNLDIKNEFYTDLEPGIYGKNIQGEFKNLLVKGEVSYGAYENPINLILNMHSSTKRGDAWSVVNNEVVIFNLYSNPNDEKTFIKITQSFKNPVYELSLFQDNHQYHASFPKIKDRAEVGLEVIKSITQTENLITGHFYILASLLGSTPQAPSISISLPIMIDLTNSANINTGIYEIAGKTYRISGDFQMSPQSAFIYAHRTGLPAITSLEEDASIYPPTVVKEIQEKNYSSFPNIFGILTKTHVFDDYVRFSHKKNAFHFNTEACTVRGHLPFGSSKIDVQYCGNFLSMQSKIVFTMDHPKYFRQVTNGSLVFKDPENIRHDKLANFLYEEIVYAFNKTSTNAFSIIGLNDQLQLMVDIKSSVQIVPIMPIYGEIEKITITDKLAWKDSQKEKYYIVFSIKQKNSSEDATYAIDLDIHNKDVAVLNQTIKIADQFFNDIMYRLSNISPEDDKVLAFANSGSNNENNEMGLYQEIYFDDFTKVNYKSIEPSFPTYISTYRPHIDHVYLNGSFNEMDKVRGHKYPIVDIAISNEIHYKVYPKNGIGNKTGIYTKSKDGQGFFLTIEGEIIPNIIQYPNESPENFASRKKNILQDNENMLNAKGTKIDDAYFVMAKTQLTQNPVKSDLADKDENEDNESLILKKAQFHTIELYQIAIKDSYQNCFSYLLSVVKTPTNKIKEFKFNSLHEIKDMNNFVGSYFVNENNKNIGTHNDFYYLSLVNIEKKQEITNQQNQSFYTLRINEAKISRDFSSVTLYPNTDSLLGQLARFYSEYDIRRNQNYSLEMFKDEIMFTINPLSRDVIKGQLIYKNDETKYFSKIAKKISNDETLFQDVIAIDPRFNNGLGQELHFIILTTRSGQKNNTHIAKFTYNSGPESIKHLIPVSDECFSAPNKESKVKRFNYLGYVLVTKDLVSYINLNTFDYWTYPVGSLDERNYIFAKEINVQNNYYFDKNAEIGVEDKDLESIQNRIFVGSDSNVYFNVNPRRGINDKKFTIINMARNIEIHPNVDSVWKARSTKLLPLTETGNFQVQSKDYSPWRVRYIKLPNEMNMDKQPGNPVATASGANTSNAQNYFSRYLPSYFQVSEKELSSSLSDMFTGLGDILDSLSQKNMPNKNILLLTDSTTKNMAFKSLAIKWLNENTSNAKERWNFKNQNLDLYNFDPSNLDQEIMYQNFKLMRESFKANRKVVLIVNLIDIVKIKELPVGKLKKEYLIDTMLSSKATTGPSIIDLANNSDTTKPHFQTPSLLYLMTVEGKHISLEDFLKRNKKNISLLLVGHEDEWNKIKEHTSATEKIHQLFSQFEITRLGAPNVAHRMSIIENFIDSANQILGNRIDFSTKDMIVQEKDPKRAILEYMVRKVEGQSKMDQNRNLIADFIHFTENLQNELKPENYPSDKDKIIINKKWVENAITTFFGLPLSYSNLPEDDILKQIQNPDFNQKWTDEGYADNDKIKATVKETFNSILTGGDKSAIPGSIMVYGEPGSGKTTLYKALVGALKLKYYDFLLSPEKNKDAQAFMFYFNDLDDEKGNNQNRFSYDQFLKHFQIFLKLPKGKRGVILFDDITKAPKKNQTQIFSLLAELMDAKDGKYAGVPIRNVALFVTWNPISDLETIYKLTKIGQKEHPSTEDLFLATFNGIENANKSLLTKWTNILNIDILNSGAKGKGLVRQLENASRQIFNHANSYVSFATTTNHAVDTIITPFEKIDARNFLNPSVTQISTLFNEWGKKASQSNSKIPAILLLAHKNGPNAQTNINDLEQTSQALKDHITSSLSVFPVNQSVRGLAHFLHHIVNNIRIHLYSSLIGTIRKHFPKDENKLLFDGYVMYMQAINDHLFYNPSLSLGKINIDERQLRLQFPEDQIKGITQLSLEIGRNFKDSSKSATNTIEFSNLMSWGKEQLMLAKMNTESAHNFRASILMQTSLELFNVVGDFTQKMTHYDNYLASNKNFKRHFETLINITPNDLSTFQPALFSKLSMFHKTMTARNESFESYDENYDSFSIPNFYLIMRLYLVALDDALYAQNWALYSSFLIKMLEHLSISTEYAQEDKIQTFLFHNKITIIRPNSQSELVSSMENFLKDKKEKIIERDANSLDPLLMDKYSKMFKQTFYKGDK